MVRNLLECLDWVAPQLEWSHALHNRKWPLNETIPKLFERNVVFRVDRRFLKHPLLSEFTSQKRSILSKNESPSFFFSAIFWPTVHMRPGKPNMWSPCKWVRNILVILPGFMEDFINWIWVPSPQSNNQTSPSTYRRKIHLLTLISIWYDRIITKTKTSTWNATYRRRVIWSRS